MSPVTTFSILLGLVAFATVLGLVWRARTGRVRQVAASSDAVVLDEVGFGSAATLLQFSTEVCAPCKPTRILLGSLARERAGVAHVDLDLTHRPDLASRFNILQTPTTLILDESRVVRARISGAPRRTDVTAALDELLASSTGSAHV